MQERNPPTQQPPEKGRFISEQEAEIRAKLFRDTYLGHLPPEPESIRCNLFSRDLVEKILAQPGCRGLRIYHSVNPVGPDPVTNLPGPVREVLLVGTDANDNDLLEVEPGKGGKGCNPLGAFLVFPAAAGTVKGLIAADPMPCPNLCGNGNSLNATG